MSWAKSSMGYSVRDEISRAYLVDQRVDMLRFYIGTPFFEASPDHVNPISLIRLRSRDSQHRSRTLRACRKAVRKRVCAGVPIVGCRMMIAARYDKAARSFPGRCLPRRRYGLTELNETS